jgi:hypothetical protein
MPKNTTRNNYLKIIILKCGISIDAMYHAYTQVKNLRLKDF